MKAPVLLLCCLSFLFSSGLFATSPVNNDVSKWSVYRNEKLGFQLQYPPTLHERRVKGTTDGKSIEAVYFSTTSSPGKRQEGIQFSIQRGINPTALSIERWYEGQRKRIKNMAPPSIQRIGGRSAVLQKVGTAFGRSFFFHVPLTRIDILTISISRPLSEGELDPTYTVILSTIEFLKPLE